MKVIKTPTVEPLVFDDVRERHPTPTGFRSACQDWARHLQAQNLSPVTINWRLAVVRRFQRFAGDRPSEWRTTDVDRFVAQLRESGRARSTIRAYLSVLRQFCAHVADARSEPALVLLPGGASDPAFSDAGGTDGDTDVGADRPSPPAAHRDASSRFDYADYLTAIGYTVADLLDDQRGSPRTREAPPR